jgi:hypothetical protein
VNHIKAAFFDTQVNEVWAASEYDEVELWKIDRMMNLAGVFHGAQIIEPGCGIGRLTPHSFIENWSAWSRLGLRYQPSHDRQVQSATLRV